ncbi:MAG TPA: hypothetical protein VJ819_14040, partial [Nocardioidaceae bacterium]|nr:hypothetical protein [Nocardioidaceae bacterium]
MYIGVRSHAFRFFAVILAVFLTVGFAGAASADGDNDPNENQGHTPVSICHFSDAGVFELIPPDNAGVINGHSHHELDQVVEADGSCPDVPPTDTGGNTGGNTGG